MIYNVKVYKCVYIFVCAQFIDFETCRNESIYLSRALLGAVLEVMCMPAEARAPPLSV